MIDDMTIDYTDEFNDAYQRLSKWRKENPGWHHNHIVDKMLADFDHVPDRQCYLGWFGIEEADVEYEIEAMIPGPLKLTDQEWSATKDV